MSQNDSSKCTVESNQKLYTIVISITLNLKRCKLHRKVPFCVGNFG